MNTPIRLLIGLGTIGGSAGVGYAIHQQLSTENIHKKLVANGYEILGNSQETWKNILASYVATVGEEKNKDLRFDNFDGKQPSNDNGAILKEKCQETLKSTSTSTLDYKRAEKWCTVPRKFEEILKKQGYTVLNVKDNDDTTHQKEWNDKIEKHNKKNENTNKRFEGLASKSDGVLKTDTESRKEIKNKCKELLEKYHYEKDYESILEKTILWCAIR